MLALDVSCSCLLGVRARTLRKQEQETVETLRGGFPDDSGSKLQDKEQQRLSSK